MLGAPWTRISLMVMGIDDWSTIYTGVSKHTSKDCSDWVLHHLRYPALLGYVLLMLELGLRLGFLAERAWIGIELAKGVKALLS